MNILIELSLHIAFNFSNILRDQNVWVNVFKIMAFTVEYIRGGKILLGISVKKQRKYKMRRK